MLNIKLLLLKSFSVLFSLMIIALFITSGFWVSLLLMIFIKRHDITYQNVLRFLIELIPSEVPAEIGLIIIIITVSLLIVVVQVWLVLFLEKKNDIFQKSIKKIENRIIAKREIDLEMGQYSESVIIRLEKEKEIQKEYLKNLEIKTELLKKYRSGYE